MSGAGGFRVRNSPAGMAGSDRETERGTVVVRHLTHQRDDLRESGLGEWGDKGRKRSPVRPELNRPRAPAGRPGGPYDVPDRGPVPSGASRYGLGPGPAERAAAAGAGGPARRPGRRADSWGRTYPPPLLRCSHLLTVYSPVRPVRGRNASHRDPADGARPGGADRVVDGARGPSYVLFPRFADEYGAPFVARRARGTRTAAGRGARTAQAVG